jgi:hypothetical protein
MWRIDANGCRDLMFPSHTTFTMLFACVTFMCFNWKFLKITMASLQICIVPFALAAHNHCSAGMFRA